MIEITLSDLNRSSFYEQTLRTIEHICDDYEITNEFGTLSMANQMVFDYLEKSHPQFNVDVEFQIESNEVSMNYCLQSGSFKSLSENPDNQNTALFVLQSLADDVSFSTDFDSLITTFHVKTKIRVQRTLQHQEVRKEIFS
jgi:hypothetical protein